MRTLRKLIASFSVVAILSSLVVSTALAGSYSDVQPSEGELYTAVEALRSAGVLDSSKTVFNGNSKLNRAEAVKLIVKAAGLKGQLPSTPTFADVPAMVGTTSNWAFEPVEVAFANGVVQGREMGGKKYFDPTAELTREQLAKLVVEAFDIPAYTPATPTFSDVSGWAVPYVEAAAKAGVVKGYGNGKFGPTDNVLRAHSALMINRVLNSQSNDNNNDDQDQDNGDEEGDDEVTYEGGALEVELSADTPDGATVPGSVANAHVATFTLTAKDDDVRVTSLTFKRTGLGDDGAFDKIALVSEDGERLSKSKGFNSDDLAIVNMLNGGFVIKAGDSVDVKVLGSVGTATGTVNFKGDTFGIALLDAEDVQSSADDVEGDFPVASDLFTVGGANAGTIEFTEDGVSPEVNVGERDVEVAALQIDGDSKNDVELNALRLEQVGSIKEDSDLANFRLYIEGEEVAMTEEAVGGFVNFTLDEPFLVEDSKNYEVRVHADILGGAGDDIDFEFDSALDVEAVDTDYGFGAGVDYTGFNMTATEVEAGAVTVVGVDPDYDSLDADKDNVVLGKLKITANSGDNLELQKVKFKFTNGTALAPVSGVDGFARVFENVELVSKSGTYDLDETGATTTVSNYGNDGLDILVKEGETLELTLRADTKEDDGWLANLNLAISLEDIGGDSLYLEETGDDQPVEDITPSSLSFNSLEGATTSATASALVQSGSKAAVVGAQGIEALAFEIEAGNASDLKLREVRVGKSSGNATFDSDTISKVSLYVDSVKPENLLVSKSGSQISTTLRLDFASKAVTVKADESRNFYVTVDVVDDASLANKTLKLSVTALDIKDADNDAVSASGLTLASTRTLTFQEAGTLNVTVDKTDPATNKTKFAVAGSTSDFIASYELTATHEPMRIEDLTITQSNPALNLKNYVSRLQLFKEGSTTPLAEKSVTGNTVTFTGINYTVALGSENLYLKAVTHEYGYNKAGAAYDADDDLAFNLDVDKFRGVESGKTFGDGASNVTDNSLGFMVVPVQVNGVSFLSSYAGELMNSELTNGENTASIIKLDTANHSNTKFGDPITLKTLIKSVTLTQSKFANTVISEYTMERISGVNDEVNGYNVYDGQVLTLTPAVQNETTYSFYVNGTLVSYTSDNSTSASEIVTGLKNAMNVAALTEGGTTTLTLTAGEDQGALVGNLSSNLTATGVDLNKIKFDLSNLASDDEVTKGQSAYFVVKANVTKDGSADTQDYLRLSFSSFNTGEVTFSSDEAGATEITQLRLPITNLTGTQISAKD